MVRLDMAKPTDMFARVPTESSNMPLNNRVYRIYHSMEPRRQAMNALPARLLLTLAQLQT